MAFFARSFRRNSSSAGIGELDREQRPVHSMSLSPRLSFELGRGPLLVSQDIAGVLGAGWIDRHIAFVDMLDDSVFIDNKGCPVSVTALFVKDPVIFHDCSFEVAKQREGYSVLFGEFSISGNAVYAETKNLSIIRFEFGDISLIRLHFLRSTTGESQNIEGQHYVLLPLKITELESQPPAVRP